MPETEKPMGDIDIPLDMSCLSLKVGHILFLQKHPKAEHTIYFPVVDTGAGDFRRIATRLIKHYKEEDIDDRLCVVITNIRRLKIYGYKSKGLILCATKKGKAEPLSPPPDSDPGDIVTVPGYELYSKDPRKVIYEEFNLIAEDFRVNSEKQAVYKGIPLEVPGKGYVRTEFLENCAIGSPIFPRRRKPADTLPD